MSNPLTKIKKCLTNTDTNNREKAGKVSKKFERFGKYILLEKLASGGMAEVFLARAIGANGIGKFVAVKRILPQFSDNDDFIDMFKDEAKIAINLSHSNIVPIFEFGISNKQLFLVMGYIEGRNLRQILNRMKKAKKFFSIEQVVYICKEIASGLDHAHRCLDGTTGKPLSITHRDMSPQNVMISFEGEVKVIDFGIAKAETQLDTTRAGTLKGKFGYMSPEQAEGQPIDLRTDIFSLGIVLWELLANDRLFIANNEINTLRKIRDCRVPSLRKINPNVPPELEKIVYKALARDRNLRYQTASALQRDLNRFLNRHYPDFAPQDFAGAVKSLYTDEILDNRKRLITYAKQTAEADNARNAQKPDLVDAEFTSTFTQNSFNNPSPDAFEEVETEDENKSGQSHSLAYQLSEMNAELANDQKDFRHMTSGDQVNLDVEKIMSEIEKVTDKKTARKKTSSFKSQEGFTNSRFNKSTVSNDSFVSMEPQSTLTRNGNSGGGVKVIAGLGVIIAGLFIANQFFPEGQSPLKRLVSVLSSDSEQKTDLQSVSDPQAAPPKAVSNTSSNVSGSKSPSILKTNPTHNIEPGWRVNIRSKPSGAAIYINGKNTKSRTPKMMTLPSQSAQITLRKEGYEPVTIKNLGKGQKRRAITVPLVTRKVAYLSVDILPPVPASVFIDGKQIVGKQLPILKHPVKANKEITVRVSSPTTGVTRSKKIRIKENKLIKLNFDLTRRPASRKR